MSEELETRVKYLTSSEIEDVNEIRKMSREVERRKLAEARAEGEKLGEERGFFKGEKSGFEKGVRHEKIKLAKKLLDEGVSIEDVARVTELSLEEILEIK